MKLLAYVDGSGAYRTQKPAGVGVVLINRDTEELVWSGGFQIGFKTNNEAEYSAVLQAMFQAQEFGCYDLVIRSDSKLIVNQVNGDWRVHENHIKDYWKAVTEERDLWFDHFVIEWIPRAQNQTADKLASGACYPDGSVRKRIAKDLARANGN